ncbi:MAG: prepilin peptidase [Lachnospiraceae bacterium]|nr:prepilin peptidase [Lachnospiraceae bacterium]
MRYIVFLIAYLYFLYIDIRRQEIDLVALTVYAVISLMTIYMTRGNITMTKLVDIIYSIIFGLIIYFVSYFSNEGIGLADGIYFVINGLLLSLKENMILFLSGLLVAFVIGIFMYYFGNKKSKSLLRMPFMPCFLPAIIGYILCIV